MVSLLWCDVSIRLRDSDHLLYSYKRHWAILRKWGLAGKGKASGTNVTPNSAEKRRRATPAKKPAKDDEEEDEPGEGDDVPSERKKAKMTAPAGITPKAESDEEADELA
jgi:hypothetical protein